MREISNNGLAGQRESILNKGQKLCRCRKIVEIKSRPEQLTEIARR